MQFIETKIEDLNKEEKELFLKSEFKRLVEDPIVKETYEKPNELKKLKEFEGNLSHAELLI